MADGGSTHRMWAGEPATACHAHPGHPCTRLSGNTVGRRWDKEMNSVCQQEQPSPPQQCAYRRSLLESSALVVGVSTDHLYISLSNILVSSDLYLLRNPTCQLWIQTENVSTKIEIIQSWITSVLRPKLPALLIEKRIDLFQGPADIAPHQFVTLVY